MKKRIAVEGLREEIVSLVCEMLERLNYDICYRHEGAYRRTWDYDIELLEDPADIVEDILKSQPELTIVCNARGYLSFLERYSKTADIPLLVLTGGGLDLIDEVKRYTPHVLAVPFRMQDLYDKLEEILG
jgi:hypothetical protein